MIAAMATAFPNLIDGRSVDSTERTPDINPSNVHDIVGEFARGTPADVEQRRRIGEAGVCQVVDVESTRAIRYPRSRRHRDPGAQGGTRTSAVPRDGQAARRRDGRSRPCRRDLQVLRRRSGADPRRQARLRAARRRSRRHARAGWRCRLDHALEFSARHPGVEDCPGARVCQLRGLQASGARARLAVDPRRHPAARRATRRRPQSGDGARLEDRSRASPRRRTSMR